MNWLEEVFAWLEYFPDGERDYGPDRKEYIKVKIKANEFLDFLYNNNVLRPNISKGHTINLTWETKSQYFKIEIRTDCYYMVSWAEKGSFTSHLISLNENDYNNILNHIKKVYEKENNPI